VVSVRLRFHRSTIDCREWYKSGETAPPDWYCARTTDGVPVGADFTVDPLLSQAGRLVLKSGAVLQHDNRGRTNGQLDRPGETCANSSNSIALNHQTGVVPFVLFASLLHIADFSICESHLHILVVEDDLRSQFGHLERLPESSGHLIHGLPTSMVGGGASAGGGGGAIVGI